ncbi:MAG: hypothetical protein K9G67_05825 [Bacteroidales bacterium]|nr:hypothetical protein [Bacteroidales bacterium]MCF8375854.1 hypothetical protein [Bacteroidales bacterium]MCF8401713.1 hypothetical protein [Bacteroidales bacterium]
MVGGAVHNGTFKIENGQWSNFLLADGGDCEVLWDGHNKYLYQGNYILATNIYPFNGCFYYDFNWHIGMEYELSPNNPYVFYTGRRKGDGEPGAKLLTFDCSSSPWVWDISYAPGDIKKIGSIGVNFNNRIFIADMEVSYHDNMFSYSDNGSDSWTSLCNAPVYDNNGNYFILIRNRFAMIDLLLQSV